MKSKEEVTAVEGETKPALVPKLRFPEFRDAQVWEEATLSKFIRSLDAGVSVNAGDRPASKAELGVLKTSCVSNGVFDPNENKVVSNELEKARLTESVTANSIIISRMNTPALVGANSYIEENAENLFLPDRLWAAKPQDGVSMRFLAHILGSDAGRSALSNLAKGSSGSMKNITKPDVLALRVIAPSYCEQQKIADCLSSLDELIAAQARKVDALKTHKKGLMQQLFPREAETQPRLRFPEFQNAEEWVIDSIGNIFETTSGGTPSRTESAYWNGDVPWVTTSLVDFGVITSAEEFITAQGLKNSSAKLFPEGTVLMAMYGQGKTRGKVALLGVKAATNQACAAILPRKDIDPYFVFLNLAGRYEEIREMSNSGGQENLSQGLIREIRFSFPPRDDEQRKVTVCLGSLVAQITAETQKLDTLKTHKKGLMQQLFPSPDEATA